MTEHNVNFDGVKVLLEEKRKHMNFTEIQEIHTPIPVTQKPVKYDPIPEVYVPKPEEPTHKPLTPAELNKKLFDLKLPIDDISLPWTDRLVLIQLVNTSKNSKLSGFISTVILSLICDQLDMDVVEVRQKIQNLKDNRWIFVHHSSGKPNYYINANKIVDMYYSTNKSVKKTTKFIYPTPEHVMRIDSQTQHINAEWYDILFDWTEE